MNNSIWHEALSQIDQKYIDRAVESYYDGKLQDNVVRVSFSGKTAVYPKKSNKIASVMLSFTAVAVLVVGLYLIFDYAVKNKVNVEMGDNVSVTTSDVSAPTVTNENEYNIIDKDGEFLDIIVPDITFNEVDFQDKEGKRVYSGYSAGGSERFFVTGQYANGTNSVPYYEDNSEIISVYDEKGKYIASYSPDKSMSECIENSFFYTISYTKKGIALIKHLLDESGEAYYYTVSFLDDSFNQISEVGIPNTFDKKNNIQLSSNGKYAMVYDTDNIHIYNIDEDVSLVKQIKYRDFFGENFKGSLIMPRISDDGEIIIAEANFSSDYSDEINKDYPTSAIQERQVVVDGINCSIDSISPTDSVVYWEGKYLSIYSGEESKFAYLLTDDNFVGNIKKVEGTPVNELESNFYSEGKLYRSDNAAVIISPAIEGYMEEEYLYSSDSLVEIPGFGEYTDDNVFSVYPVTIGSNNNGDKLRIISINSEKFEIDSVDISHNEKLYNDCIITSYDGDKLNITDFNGTITKTIPIKKGQFIEIVSVSENREYLLVVLNDSDSERRNILIYKSEELIFETQYSDISNIEINNEGTVFFTSTFGDRFVMRYIDDGYSVIRLDETDIYLINVANDSQQPNISLSMNKSPNSYIGAGPDEAFYVVNPENQYITKFCSVEKAVDMYSPVFPEGDNSSDYRFLFNGNRPIAIRREKVKDGVYNYYVLSFDTRMLLSKIGTLNIPDSFFNFDNVRISTDGKYLIDLHYGANYNSDNYIRIYSLENYELYAEIKDLWKSIGEFGIDEVFEARVSSDGSKLLIITEGMSAYHEYFSDETNVIYASVIDIESGRVPKSMGLSNSEKVIKALQYNDGIAVFTDKALYLCNEENVKSCSLPSEITSIKDCSISRNGEYVVIVTDADDVYEYEIKTDDTQEFSLIAVEDEAMQFGEIGAVCVNDSGIICYNCINQNFGGPRISYNIQS